MPSEAELERMIIRIMGDGTSYQKTIKEAQDTTKMFEGGLQMTSKRISIMGMQLRGYGAQATAMLMPLVGLAGTTGEIWKGVSLAAQAEGLEVDFGTLLHSQEKGTQMVAKLQKFAAETPLNMGDLQQFTKMLLQSQVAGEDIIPTLKDIGDVAMGDAQKIHGLAYAFGQVKTFGRLMGGELMQLRNAGFDPLKEISRTTGKDMGTLRQEMEKGLITFEMVANAFKTASSAGGDFQDGMLSASKTLKGLFSTMQDDMDAVARSIGVIVIETFHLKDAMKMISSAAQAVTEFLQSIPSWAKSVLVVLGMLGAAAIAFAALWPFIGGSVMAVLVMIKTVLLFILNPFAWVTAAVIGLKVALGLLLTPFGWILIAVTALAGALALLVSGFITKAGGVQAAVELVKQAFIDLWAWMLPIRRAVEGLFDSIKAAAIVAWETMQKAATDFYDMILGYLEKYGIDNKDTWNEVRDVVLTAILAIQFAVENFNLIWTELMRIIPVASNAAWQIILKGFDFLWAAIQYGAVSAINFMLNNAFMPLTAALYVILMAAQTNFKLTFAAIWEIVVAVFRDLMAKAEALGDAIMGALEGDTDAVSAAWGAFGKDLDLSKINLNLRGVKIDALDEMEASMKKKMGDAWTAVEDETKSGAEKVGQAGKPLVEAFGKFKDERWGALFGPEAAAEAATQAEETGKKVGDKMAKGIEKELPKVDSVLMGSLDALTRIEEFKERMAAGRKTPGAAAGTGVVFAPALPDPPKKVEKDQVDILKEIRDVLKADKDTMIIEPAGLA